MSRGRTLARALLLLLLVVTPILGDADAEADPLPDAGPEAEAEPMAESDPQYYPGYGPPPPQWGPPPPGGPGGRPPPSACELTNQCCGMAGRNCCLGGKRCYTVWERKCDREDNPECRVRIEQKCYGTRVKDCRVVSDVQYKTFKAEVCAPKPLTRCFTYNKKVCVPSTQPSYKEISWVNDRLERIGQEVKQHCADVKTYNCSVKMETRIVPERVPRPIIRRKLRKRCMMVQDTGPESEVEVPVVRIVYRNVCYNVNVPQCSVSPCGAQGFCNAPQNVCFQNQFNTNTVCPLAAAAAGAGGGAVGAGVMPRQNCQQIRQPVCNSSPGGPCNPGNQQCCSSVPQRICRQVPQRIVDRVKQKLPGRISWREDCKDFFQNITEYIYENSNRTEQVPIRDCEPVVRNECHNVTIPKFRVVTEQKKDRVTVMLPACRHRVVKDRYCHTFPAGDLTCQDQMIRRGFRVNRIVCDQDRDRPFCFKFPLADCRLGSNSKCRMVPRQVCTDTGGCSRDPQCQSCNNFVQRGPGFGSCPSSTCGNWYPTQSDADAFNETFAGDWDAGMRALPAMAGYGGGGGAVGGRGFYEPQMQPQLVDGVVGAVGPGGGQGYYNGGGGAASMGMYQQGSGGNYFPGATMAVGTEQGMMGGPTGGPVIGGMLPPPLQGAGSTYDPVVGRGMPLPPGSPGYDDPSTISNRMGYYGPPMARVAAETPVVAEGKQDGENTASVAEEEDQDGMTALVEEEVDFDLES